MQRLGVAYLCSEIAVPDTSQTSAKTQSSKTPKSESFYSTHIVQMWIMFMNSICLRHKNGQRSVHLFTWQDSVVPAQTILSSNQLSPELLSCSQLILWSCSNSSFYIFLSLVLSEPFYSLLSYFLKITFYEKYFFCNDMTHFLS